MVLLVGGYKVLRRHLDSQVDHLVAVVGQNDVHQVFADVVNVALDGGQDYLAPDRAVQPVHVRFQAGDREFHGLGGLEHFGDDQLVGVELAAYLRHAGHQGPVDDVQRSAFQQRFIQVFGQALFGAIDDSQGQPLIQREAAPLFFRRLGGFVAKVGSEGGDRVVAPVPYQVLGQPPLFLGDGGVPLEQFGVDDCHVQASLDAMVQKH